MKNNLEKETQYAIPSKYRKMENLHIVFWLFKDLSWCIGIKPLGIAMIIPTLIISIIITNRTKDLVSELCHNIAVTLWILANSYWMISEFFSFDSKPLLGYTYKHLALLPFSLGIFVLGYYYLIYRFSKKADQVN